MARPISNTDNYFGLTERHSVLTPFLSLAQNEDRIVNGRRVGIKRRSMCFSGILLSAELPLDFQLVMPSAVVGSPSA